MMEETNSSQGETCLQRKDEIDPELQVCNLPCYWGGVWRLPVHNTWTLTLWVEVEKMQCMNDTHDM